MKSLRESLETEKELRVKLEKVGQADNEFVFKL